MPRNIPNKILIAATISLSVALGGIPLAASAAARPATSSAGQVSPRAAVPWRRVGPGWVLTQYWPGRFGFVKKAVAAPVTLYLISPAGRRYQLHRWASTKQPLYVVDWSGDKTRVVLFAPLTGRLSQLTLATGRVSPIRLPAGVSPYFTVSYTRPAGPGLLAVRKIRNRTQLVQLSLTGRLVKVLASGSHDGTFVSSSAGRTIAVGGAAGLQLVSASGGVVRRLAVPRTGSSGCLPARWWNSRTILATCVAKGTHHDRLWLVPASGTRPTPLTPQRGRHSPDPGDLDAWATSGSLYLQSITSNGGLLIFRPGANGGLRLIRPPGSAYDNWVLAAHGSRLLVNEVAPCRGTASARWFSPATGRAQTLVKAPRGRAGAVSVIPFGPPLADIAISVGCAAGRASRELSSPGTTGVAPGLLSRR
jgi:TolB protein